MYLYIFEGTEAKVSVIRGWREILYHIFEISPAYNKVFLRNEKTYYLYNIFRLIYLYK